MKAIHKLLLPILLFCLILGTVPTAFAQEAVSFADETVNIDFIDNTGEARIVECGEHIADAELTWSTNPPEVADYYRVILDLGQSLVVDVDTKSNEDERFDYILQLFDINGNSLADSDDEAAPGETDGLDPYLKYTATKYGTYIVAVSTWYAAETSSSYEITFECTAGEPVSEVEPGELLASTGRPDGLLISIDRETGITDFRAPLGGIGEVVDIEFRDDGVLFGAAVDEINKDGIIITTGIIITIDPNTGAETQVGTLQSGYVTALEFGANPVDSLYGIYQAPDQAVSQLGTINQANGEFTVVGKTDYKTVHGLAYDSRTGTMYGVGSGSDGVELITIDLATGLATGVGPTGSDIQILAIDFGPDGKLYGVTAPFKADNGTLVTNLVTIDTSDGTATKAAVLDVGSSIKVNGMTFKPGWLPQSDNKIITSLDDNPFVGRVIDKFKFEGDLGELVTIVLDILNKESEGELSPENAGTLPYVIKTASKCSKKNLLVDGEFKGRAFITLRDAICDRDFRVRERGPMPLTIETTLPAKGLYHIILMQPVPRALRVDYSLTMTSSLNAFKTLEATRLIEPRECKDHEEEVTIDSTEQQSGVITLKSSSSLTSADESIIVIPEEPAADGDVEVGQTVSDTKIATPDTETLQEPTADGGHQQVQPTQETTVTDDGDGAKSVEGDTGNLVEEDPTDLSKS